MSILRYPGGKSKPAIQKLISSYAPGHYTDYFEPFVGGGGIFDTIPRTKTRWINDFNPHLIEVYWALRDHHKEFIEACRAIAPAQPGEPEIRTPTGKIYNKRLYEQFYRFLYNEENSDPVFRNLYPAVRYLYLNRTGRFGRVMTEGDQRKRTQISNSAGWNMVMTDRMEVAAEQLQGTRITRGDYEELLTAPGIDPWIYADPPYFCDTLSPKSGKWYQHGFTMNDHRRFAECARQCRHNLCISYDDHPAIRELYPISDFFIYPVSWKYCGSSLAKKPEGRELLITNYPKVTTGLADDETLIDICSDEALESYGCLTTSISTSLTSPPFRAPVSAMELEL